MNGRIDARLLVSSLDDVSELRKDRAASSRAARRASEPGSTKIAQPPAMPAHGARQHRGRTDLLEAQHAEQLAEAVELLLEERRDGLVGRIASRDAGAAGRDDRATRGRVAAASRTMSRDVGRLVADERRAPTTAWPCRFEQLGDRLRRSCRSRACACR